MKKIISVCFILLIFILGLSFVNANYYWSQEGNANYDLGYSGTTDIAYGSNYINPNSDITGENYNLCSITKSDYTPIASDFGQTGDLKVVVTDKTTDKLSIYNQDCSLFDEIDVVQDIMAMPVLLRPKNYYDQQIVVLTDIALKSYEYNIDLGSFELKNDISLGSYANDNYYYLTCLDEYVDSSRDEKCMVVVFTGINHYGLIFNMVNDSFELKSGAFPDLIREYDGYSGLSNFRNPVDDYNFYIPFGFFAERNELLAGNLYDEDFVNLTEYDTDTLFYINPLDFKDSSDFIARIGNNYRIFTYRFTGRSTSGYSNVVGINDLSGNDLFFVAFNISKGGNYDMDNISNKRLSNWVVADYDKDGVNEGCFLIKNVDNEIWLQCYESSLGNSNGDIRVNYTGLMSENLSNFVLADFVPSKSVLGVATKEGIFYPNEKNYSTDKIVDWGFVITTFQDIYSQNPMYVYTDDDEGFIVYADVENDSCGNGICEYWENPLSCYVDCFMLAPDEDEEGEYREGSHCESDEDCEGGLKCEYGVCTLLTFGYECTEDSDCLSGDCLNGYCTKASWWEKLDASRKQQFGDSENTLNFIALFFMLGVAGFLGYYGNVWMGVGSLYVTGIFFTIVGWLSVFILFGLILTGIIAIVFKLTMGSGQG